MGCQTPQETLGQALVQLNIGGLETVAFLFLAQCGRAACLFSFFACELGLPASSLLFFEAALVMVAWHVA